MGTTPISVLSSRVCQRLEEELPPPNGSGPIFWNLVNELNSAVAEAQNDLLLLVGRPDITANLPLTLIPNSVWQPLPKGILLLTDIYGQSGRLRKCSLFDLDYLQSASGSDWENDTSQSPIRWAPIGLTMYLVYPAPASPITLTASGIAYPITTPFPYTGSELVPFNDSFFIALELYAAHYCRLKELGAEFEESLQLLDQYMMLAKRMTAIEDRRDPVLFSRSYGGRTGLDSILSR